MKDERNYGKYSNCYEKFKLDEDEKEYYNWKRGLTSFYKYKDEPVEKEENAEAKKDFWKVFGYTALVMVFFLILIVVAAILL